MLRELTASFIIVAICVVIHITVIVLLAEWLLDRHEERKIQGKMANFLIVLIIVFAILIGIHLFETALWAMFYWSWNLFEDFETSLYFSMTSYTTIGYGDVVLPKKWRLLGVIEGISGVLLCGVSTAFIFVVLNGLFQIRLKKPSDKAN